MAKKLDINVTKEGIERNFKLLNAALAEYDKKIAALGNGGIDEATVKRLIAEREEVVRKWVLALLAKLGFNLDDYRCVYANITADDYIDFRVVNEDKNREYTLRWSKDGINILGHDGSEAETVTGQIDFKNKEFGVQYKKHQPYITGRSDYDFSGFFDVGYLEGGIFHNLQLGNMLFGDVYKTPLGNNFSPWIDCEFHNCDFGGGSFGNYLKNTKFYNCDMRQVNAAFPDPYYPDPLNGIKPIIGPKFLYKIVGPNFSTPEGLRNIKAGTIVSTGVDGLNFMALVDSPELSSDVYERDESQWLKYESKIFQYYNDDDCLYENCNMDGHALGYRRNSTFKNCVMTNIVADMNLSSCTFINCDLRNAVINTLSDCTFINCDMRNIVVTSAWNNSVFTNCNIDGLVNISPNSIYNCDFRGSTLRDCVAAFIFYQSNFEGVDFRGSEFHYNVWVNNTDGANRTVLQENNFKNSDLRNVKFLYADGSIANNDFTGAKIKNTIFDDADTRTMLEGNNNIFTDVDFTTPDESKFNFHADRHSFSVTVADTGVSAGLTLDNGTATLAGSKATALVSGGAVRLTAMADHEGEGAVYYNLDTGKWQAQNGSGEPFDIGDMRKEVYDTNDNGQVDIAELARSVEYIELVPEPEEGQALVFDAAVGKFKPKDVKQAIDGGSAHSVYLVMQKIDGGGAYG